MSQRGTITSNAGEMARPNRPEQSPTGAVQASRKRASPPWSGPGVRASFGE
jgi:hypothetical protein